MYLQCNDWYVSYFINLQPNLPRPVSCNTVTYNQILSNYTLEGLNRILDENSTVTTCKYYEEIKAYQYKLHKFFTSQNTSNTTIASITYLLQSAAESLQAIQVKLCYIITNHQLL